MYKKRSIVHAGSACIYRYMRGCVYKPVPPGIGRCFASNAISLVYYKKQQKPVHYSPYLPDARTSVTGCSSLQPRHQMKALLMHFPTSHQTLGLELQCRCSSYSKKGCLGNQDKQVYYRDWLSIAHTGTHSRYQVCELAF